MDEFNNELSPVPTKLDISPSKYKRISSFITDAFNRDVNPKFNKNSLP